VRIGVLSAGASPGTLSEAFPEGLRALGYVPGETILLEFRDTGGRDELISELTSELTRMPVAALVIAPASAARGITELTGSLPIVVPFGDLVAFGLVTSLAHPGGNITGLSSVTAELSGKRLQLLTEAVPGISRVAVLWWAGGTDRYFRETEAAAGALGIQVRSLGVSDRREFESMLSTMEVDQLDALVVAPGPIFGVDAGLAITQLANQLRLPAIFEGGGYAKSGGLMAYGPNLRDLTRRSAAYVDKIIKGARPADLPVELPTSFDFVINLKTAQALGLTIPPSVLAQATEVVQ
jgi:putative ABC transport system substrate-binding protein